MSDIRGNAILVAVQVPQRGALKMFEGNLQACPLSEKDKPIKKKFDEALAADQMIRCERCKRCWFDIELKGDGICKRCHGKDDRKRPDEPLFYSKENYLDFGDVPDFLPALHPAEDVGKIYEELPLRSYLCFPTSSSFTNHRALHSPRLFVTFQTRSSLLVWRMWLHRGLRS